MAHARSKISKIANDLLFDRTLFNSWYLTFAMPVHILIVSSSHKKEFFKLK